MPKLKAQIDKEKMQQTLSIALIKRGASPRSLGADIGKRLGKTDKTGRKLLKDPSLLTVGELKTLKLTAEEITELVGC